LLLKCEELMLWLMMKVDDSLSWYVELDLSIRNPKQTRGRIPKLQVEDGRVVRAEH
jgi:hypothetical protein